MIGGLGGSISRLCSLGGRSVGTMVDGLRVSSISARSSRCGALQLILDLTLTVGD